LKEVLLDHCASWTAMTTQRRWKDLFKGERPLVDHYCRVLEVVHGAAGWHPHFHVVLLTPTLSPDEEDELRLCITELWVDQMYKVTAGRRAPLAQHQHWSPDVPITYAAKGDVRPRTAERHTSSQGPFDLARSALAGDRHAGALYREYLEPFDAFSPGLNGWDRRFPTREVFGYDAITDLAAGEAIPGMSTNEAGETAVAETEGAPSPLPATADKATARTAASPTTEHTLPVSTVPPTATIIASLPLAWWAWLARKRGARQGVLRAAEWGGTAGVVQYLTPLVWRMLTGDCDCPEQFFDVVLEAISPKSHRQYPPDETGTVPSRYASI
jgi:hypothetical protein